MVATQDLGKDQIPILDSHCNDSKGKSEYGDYCTNKSNDDITESVGVESDGKKSEEEYGIPDVIEAMKASSLLCFGLG